MSYRRVLQVDRARKFASYENKFARFFFGRDKRAEKIWRNPSATTADAPRGPRDGFAQNVFTVENRRESSRQCDR